MTDLTKLAEAVRDACEEYVNNDASGCDVFHSFDEIDLQAIIAAHAHPEPEPDGEKMAELIKELRRCIAVVNDHNYPVLALAASRLSDLLERTEAARLAAQARATQLEAARIRYEVKAYEALEQLAAECERSSALAAFIDYWSYDGHLQTYQSREEFRKAAREAAQSSQENGK